MFRRNGSKLSKISPLSAPPNANGAVQTRIEGNYQPDELRPLYFLHIAKTGGTSLTAALKDFYDAGEVISDEGNLSVDFIKAHEHRLSATTFLHGHAHHGVMSYLLGRARAITLLRNPKDQAVSNYLHLVRDLDNPLRSSAIGLGFTGFMTTYWQYAVYQTVALDVSITSAPARFPEDLEARVGQVFTLLDKMFFVGCLEQIDDLCPLLSLLLGLPACLRVPHLNSAAEHGVDRDTLDRLRDEYEALHGKAAIAHLLALEQAVYQKVASLRVRHERRCIEQAFFVNSMRSASPPTGYDGAQGTIHLAGNWRPPEMTSDGPGWWTDSDERSTLLVELSPAAHALEAEIYVTHYVSDLVFEADGLVLGHSLQTTANDTRRIRVDLRPVCAQRERRVILTMRLVRLTGPSVPPHYPALALRNFQLV
jgi:hypothetical protein